MAEPSSVKEAQIAFMCQFCDKQNVKWKCEDCGIYLCNACRETIHPRLKSSDKHIILSIQDIGKRQCYDDEPWYHGKMSRKDAIELLHKHKHMGDGTFLVRESDSKIDRFVIDVLVDGEVKHCKIERMVDSGKFIFGREVVDRLNDVIKLEFDLGKFPIKLTVPVPKDSLNKK